MDPTSWADLLFTYGPYGVLALFGLWIAPRQTKLFLSSDRQDKIAHSLSGGIAAVTWLVVVGMVWFIYSSWPPKQVYEGEFGKHGEDTQFYPSHPDFFIGTSSTAGGNRLLWKFVIVTRTGKVGDEEVYSFTRSLNGKFYDYEIPVRLLKERKLRLFSTRNNPGALFYDDDGDRSTDPIEYEATYVRVMQKAAPGWLDVYAQENKEQQVIQQLRSPNPFFQAQGRAQLRYIPSAKLPSMIDSEDTPPEVRHQLEIQKVWRESRPQEIR